VNLRPAVPAAAAARRSRARVPLAALGLALVVALGGCTIPGFGASPSSGKESDSGTGSGSEWFWYREGDAVGSPSNRPARPAASSTSTPALPTVPAASSAPECPSRLDRVTKPLVATGGVGRGTLTWDHVDDPRIVEYRVAAVLQEFGGGEDVSTRTWITVARPTAGCAEMTATVSDLIAGRHYVFWLDAVLSLPNGTIREPMIGRSNAVLVE
jgi:hypothetical protein